MQHRKLYGLLVTLLELIIRMLISLFVKTAYSGIARRYRRIPVLTMSGSGSSKTRSYRSMLRMQKMIGEFI